MERQRLREKVWNGELLSDEELSELRRAAQQEGGPMWRTTVAQALINADAVSAAIPILEAVRRDFPRDVQAHLALARALISVEKWSEAEAPLNQALALNPGDPEPMKALATLALRRAEWNRAKALVQEVLNTVKGIAEDGATLLIVTHEMCFARDVSSRVVFMEQGRIHEEGPPAEIFGNPRSTRLAEFLRNTRH